MLVMDGHSINQKMASVYLDARWSLRTLDVHLVILSDLLRKIFVLLMHVIC